MYIYQAAIKRLRANIVVEDTVLFTTAFEDKVLFTTATHS